MSQRARSALNYRKTLWPLRGHARRFLFELPSRIREPLRLGRFLTQARIRSGSKAAELNKALVGPARTRMLFSSDKKRLNRDSVARPTDPSSSRLGGRVEPLRAVGSPGSGAQDSLAIFAGGPRMLMWILGHRLKHA